MANPVNPVNVNPPSLMYSLFAAGAKSVVETAASNIAQLGMLFVGGSWMLSNKMDAIKDGVKEIFKDIGKDVKKELGKAGESIKEDMKEALSEIDKTLDEATKKAGEMSGNNIRNVGLPTTKALGDVFSNFYKEFTWDIVTEVLPVALAGIAAWGVVSVGIPAAINYAFKVWEANIGKPKLATETHIVGWFDSWFATKRQKPIFNDDVSRKIDDIIKAIPNIVKNKGVLQNVLLYGPGGTGKTMISKYIAENSHLNYIMMSGGDLPQYIKRGEHVTEFNKLIDKAMSYSTPTIIFIDEAESLAKDRGQIKKQELLELQNAFLNRTGETDTGKKSDFSKKVMLILATNRMEDLDQAVLSRMDYKIFIGPPALKERIAMLQLYITKFFNEAEIAEFFTDKDVENIANKIGNTFSGRSIYKMLNAMIAKKSTTDDNALTKEIIDQVVDDFVAQEKEIQFAKANPRSMLTARQQAASVKAAAKVSEVAKPVLPVKAKIKVLPHTAPAA